LAILLLPLSSLFGFLSVISSLVPFLKESHQVCPGPVSLLKNLLLWRFEMAQAKALIPGTVSGCAIVAINFILSLKAVSSSADSSVGLPGVVVFHLWFQRLEIVCLGTPNSFDTLNIDIPSLTACRANCMSSSFHDR